MHRNALVCVAAFCLCAGLACGEKPVDVETEKKAIHRILEINEQALLKGDLEMISEIVTDDYTYIVHGGDVMKASRKMILDNFRQQFENGKYVSVDRLMEPIVSVSEDGRMAYVIGRNVFKYMPNDAPEDAEPKKVIDAGLFVFEKRMDRWVEVASVQTFGENDR